MQNTTVKYNTWAYVTSISHMWVMQNKPTFLADAYLTCRAPFLAIFVLPFKSSVSNVALQVFLCTDLWKDAKTLHSAYCDSKGVTEAFIKNGMAHALHALGVGAQADPAHWQYDVVINSVERRVCCHVFQLLCVCTTSD